MIETGYDGGRRAMSWQDMGTYWAWRSSDEMPPPPSVKRLEYATLVYPHCEFRLCTGVWDDDRYTPLHQDELRQHVSQGARVVRE